MDPLGKFASSNSHPPTKKNPPTTRNNNTSNMPSINWTEGPLIATVGGEYFCFEKVHTMAWQSSFHLLGRTVYGSGHKGSGFRSRIQGNRVSGLD